MTAIIIPLIISNALGFAAATPAAIAPIRRELLLRRRLKTVTRKKFRHQIRQQHTAAEQVRRATTIDPWLGRGGTHVFREI